MGCFPPRSLGPRTVKLKTLQRQGFQGFHLEEQKRIPHLNLVFSVVFWDFRLVNDRPKHHALISIIKIVLKYD